MEFTVDKNQDQNFLTEGEKKKTQKQKATNSYHVLSATRWHKISSCCCQNRNEKLKKLEAVSKIKKC